MSDYKCINCGKIKESEIKCNCPVCGYSMFEMPYDRKKVLTESIQQFISRLMVTKVCNEDFYFSRTSNKTDENGNSVIIKKETDDKRQKPDYNKIQNYICDTEKTEEFIKKINASLDKFLKYFNGSYSQSYSVGYDGLKLRIKKYDDILCAALKEFSIKSDLKEVDFPKAKVICTYSKDDDLADEIINLICDLRKLSDKLFKFIERNNFYGYDYSEKYENKYVKTDEEDCLSNIRKYKRKLDKVLNKTYDVDVFSDGNKEIGEMIKTMWEIIACIVSVPCVHTNYQYVLENGEIVSDKDFNLSIENILSSRYEEIEDIVLTDAFLCDQDEDSVFDIYNKMLDLDTMGFMYADKSQLLRVGQSEAELNKLIGLQSIKDSVSKIKAYALSNKGRDNLNLHMCFYGNPGTGKTEVARIIAGILYENGILPSNTVVEADRGKLVGQYVGETAQKTARIINQSMGGVLFIDEAYSLIPKDGWGGDYGHESLATLLKAMEDYRGKFCVIFAGYRNEMKRMLESNPGLVSRIQFELDFPNYSRDELGDITRLMLSEKEYSAEAAVINRVLDITEIKRKSENFANAREIRNILDQIIMCQNMRCIGTDDREICIADVNRYISDENINLPTTGTEFEKVLLSGEDELEALVGLDSVKRMVKKIRAYAKRNKDEKNFNLHMCFYGNPGTGKTEVARIISRILHDAGVLKEAKLIETDAHGLIGEHVGETAPKTMNIINNAMDGVLFIDEAYVLSDKSKGNGGYGDEAVATLLKEMEDRRGRFCTILAGYKDEMQNLLSSNPGFESRIQFKLDFPDYTREELGLIAKAFVKGRYEIESDALQKLLDVADYFRAQPNFANARTIRNILDQVIMNQNLRTEDDPSDIITIDDVEDYILDENIDLNKKENVHKIGFQA